MMETTKMSYESSQGLKATIHGSIYQLKLLMLFLQRGLEKGCKFKLSTEEKGVGAFDDVIFETEEKKLCLQAKHKQDPKKTLTYYDLFPLVKFNSNYKKQLTKKPFALCKYFTSYIEALQSKDGAVSKLEHVVICTNFGFNLNTKGKLADEYGCYVTLLEIDLNLTENELLKDIFTPSYNQAKLYKVSYIQSNCKYWKELQDIYPAEIGMFRKSLVFALDQPNENDLDSILSKEMGLKLGLSDSTSFYNDIQVQMLNWIKEKEGVFQTNELGLDVFQAAQRRLYNSILSGITLATCTKFKDCKIQFQKANIDNLKIEEFLNSRNHPILWINSSSTFFTGTKILKCLQDTKQFKTMDSSIVMPISSAIKLSYIISGALVSKTLAGASKIMILLNEELNMAPGNLRELIELLKNIHCFIKVVVIGLTFVISGDIPHILVNDIFTYNSLMQTSKDSLLEMQVNLQRKGLKLKDFLGEKELEGLTQDMILALLEAYGKETTRKICFNHICQFGAEELPIEISNAEIFLETFLSYLKSNAFKIQEIWHPTCIISPDASNASDFLKVLQKEESSFVAYFNSISGQINCEPMFPHELAISTDELKMKDFQNFCKTNDTRIIFWLVLTGKTFICKATYNGQFYSHRRLTMSDLVDGEISKLLNSDKPLAKFVFYGETTENELAQMLKIRNGNNFKNFKKNCIVLKKSCSFNDETNLHTKSSNLPLYFIKVENQAMRLKCFVKSLAIIRPYLTQSNNVEFLASFINQNVVIITGDPGMGKTTSLFQLAKSRCTKNWVILIKLKDCKGAAENIKSKPTRSCVENFLTTFVSSDWKTANILKLKLLHSNLTPMPILILFDGFDELDIVSQNKFLGIFEFLKEAKITYWVTSRNHKKVQLEDKLSSLAFQFLPLNSVSQQELLENYYRGIPQIYFSLDIDKAKTFDLMSTNHKILELTRKFMQKVPTVCGKAFQELLSIPLQLRLVVSSYDIKLLISDKITVVNTNILQIYKTFTNQKYEIYYANKIGQGNNILSPYCKNAITKQLNKDHGTIALSLLCSDLRVESGLPSKEDISYAELLPVGILQSTSIEKEPYFIHRTLAEYFCALLLHSRLTKKSQRKKVTTFLKQTFFVAEFKVVKTFLDNLLMESNEWYKMLNVERLITEPSRSQLEFRDSLNRSLLHHACDIGNNIAVQKLLNNGLALDDIDLLDMSPVHYAVHYGHKEVVIRILGFLADIDISQNMFSNVPLTIDKIVGDNIFPADVAGKSTLCKFLDQVHGNNKSLIQTAISEGHLRIACILILHGASVDRLTLAEKEEVLIYAYLKMYENAADTQAVPVIGLLALHVPSTIVDFSTDYEFPRFLAVFFILGHIKVVQAVIEAVPKPQQRFKILSTDYNSYLPIHRLMENKSLNGCFFDDENCLVVLRDFLHIMNKCGIEFKHDNSMRVLLITLAVSGNIKSFNYIVNKFRIKSEFIQGTNFDDVAKQRQIEMIAYMWTNYRNIQYPGNELQNAVETHSVSVIKYLLKNGATWNVMNGDIVEKALIGWAQTRLSFPDDRVNTIKLILKNRKLLRLYNLNKYVNLSAEYECWEIVEYLINECDAKFENPSNVETYIYSKIKGLNIFDINKVFKDGFTLLHFATATNKVSYIRYLLENGANVNATNDVGRSALHYDLQRSYNILYRPYRHNTSTRLLLENGAIYNLVDKDGKTPTSTIGFIINKVFKNIHETKSNIKIINERSDNWGDQHDTLLAILNAKNSSNLNLLQFSLKTGNTEFALYLLRNRNRIVKLNHLNMQDEFGNTPAHIAAFNDYSSVLEELLKNGAKYNLKNFEGKTPFEMTTCDCESYKILKYVKSNFNALENGDLEQLKRNPKTTLFAKDESGHTLLHLVAKLGYQKIAEYLISNEVEISTTDDVGKLPLHYAALNNKQKLIKLLLTHGSIFNEKDREGHTPLDLCKTSDLLLLCCKVFQNIRNDELENVLVSLKQVSSDTIKCITKVYDSVGYTLLHYAAHSDCYELVEILLANGAIFNPPSRDGIDVFIKTPKSLAVNNKIIKILLILEQLFESKSNFCVPLTDINPAILKEAINCNEQTLLHASVGNLWRIKYFVKIGCDVNAIDKDGKTVHDIASEKGQISCQYLLQKLMNEGQNRICV